MSILKILAVVAIGFLVVLRREWIGRCINWLDQHNGLMTFLATAAIAALTYFLVTTSNRQWQTMQNQLGESTKEFALTQRAAVYLGLSDGKVMDFELQGNDEEIVAYARNYGQSTAESVQIELFPMTDIINGAPQLHKIPAFKGFSGAPSFKYAVPPGFPFRVYSLYDQKLREAVDAGKADLEVAGRISYTDKFGSYCEPFDVAYLRKPISRFELREARSSLCERKAFGLLNFTMGPITGPGTTFSKPFIVPTPAQK